MSESSAVFGTASLTPDDEVVVGTYGSWTVEYTVGELGVDDGSTVLVAFSQTSDMGTPQFGDPRDDNYCSVSTDGEATVSGSYDPEGYVRPFKHAIVIDVEDGSLAPGETISVRLGDRSKGSRGLQAQSFVERDFRFRVLVDAHNTGDYEESSGELTYDLVAGEAYRLAAVLPSTIEPGERATLSVRAEDYWGNVASEYEATVNVSSESETVHLEGGTGSTDLRFDSPGIHRITVEDPERGLSATTNPVRCTVDPGRRTYWGDVHGQSGETVGTGTVRDYFAFGRNAAFLDFAAHAGNDFQITDEIWNDITTAVRDFHAPGSFVTFHCYEWSANTSVGGDHNVYFKGDNPELNRSSQWLVDPEDRAAGTRPIQALYDLYGDREDVLIIPHQGGRPAALDAFDPALSPFVEITSVWGVFESFAQDALDLGHVGFVGGSDDHCGRPGTAPPDNLAKHNVSGGLMAASATRLSRDSLWEAFTSKRVYATTGARILLDVDIAGYSMGEAGESDGPVPVTAEAHGTAPVQTIDLFRDRTRVASTSFATGTDRIEIRWTGAKGRTRDKLIDWSGGASLDRGRIVDAEAFGFDHPDQGIQYRSDSDIEWEAYTSGNYEGVRLAVEAPETATLTVGTPHAGTSVRLDELDGTMIDAGHLDARLELNRTGTCSEADVTAAFEDNPDSGTHHYYVRLMQVDGEMAWSSPVELTVN